MVKLKDTDMVITCYKAGKMKQSHIKDICLNVLGYHHFKKRLYQVSENEFNFILTIENDFFEDKKSKYRNSNKRTRFKNTNKFFN